MNQKSPKGNVSADLNWNFYTQKGEKITWIQDKTTVKALSINHFFWWEPSDKIKDMMIFNKALEEMWDN